MNLGVAARSIALVGVGLLAGLWWSRSQAATEKASTKALRPSSTTVVSPSAEPLVHRDQVSAAYLSAIAQAAAQPREAEHVPSDDPQVNEPDPDDYVRRARAEPVDTTWAPEQTAKLEAELSQAAAHLDFRFTNLSCRTSQCVVEMDFPSLKGARSAFKTGFAHELQQTKCVQRWVIPEGRDDAPAHSVLVLTCARPDAASLAAH